MKNRTLFVKNMVCDRCKQAVRRAAENAGIAPLGVELGEVALAEPPEPEPLARFREALRVSGFELLDDRRQQLVERIKAVVIDLVHHRNDDRKVNLSDFLTGKLGRDYSSLSSLFSEVEGTTLEQFLIRQKIERVKELLVYDELSLNEITDLLHYSSVAHLSSQFKKVTGLTPSHFKRIGEQKRVPLDQI
ncbi:MAG: AraC family transcriptional regulator [Cytophagaceae bacterium]|nr:AraC family transcriptional regulator [Cytophagaceae bacterium]